MGKTSLAYLLSHILGTKLHYLNGPNLQKPSDLVSVLSFIKEKEILFIDEIHAVSKEILEILYPVLEDNGLNVIIGKDYNSKIVNLKLPNFTMIGATTEINKIPLPFLNRFPIRLELEPYSLIELQKIILNNANHLNLHLTEKAAVLIASYARETPRIGINLLKRIDDFRIVKNYPTITPSLLLKIFQQMQLHPLGLNNLAQFLNLSPEHILNFTEPLLLKHELILRTAKGRKLTKKGFEYLEKIKSN